MNGCMVFNTVFNSISIILQQPVHLSVLFWSFLTNAPVFRTIFFQSHWLISNITIVETTDSGEKGMNPVAMTIINLLEYMYFVEVKSSTMKTFLKEC